MSRSGVGDLVFLHTYINHCCEQQTLAEWDGLTSYPPDGSSEQPHSQFSRMSCMQDFQVGSSFFRFLCEFGDV